MLNTIRLALVLVGAVLLAAAAGLFTRQPWATAVWPWPDGRLSYIFLSSIAAAIGAPVVWIGVTGELGAIAPGALNLGVMYAGMAVHLRRLAAERGEPRLAMVAATCAVAVAGCLALWLWARRHPIRDPRPTPAPVRLSLAAFALVLIAVGTALVRQAPHVFPWPLKPETSVMFGWIFLGASIYFIHGVLVPRWHDAAGQLIGFLAYDLVLIGPSLAHFGSVKPEHRASLAVYVAVLAWSGALAATYLFVHRPTRLLPRR